MRKSTVEAAGNRNLLGVAGAIALAVAGIFAATPLGFGVTGDSVAYLHAAQRFPPLYPSLIALARVIVPDPQSAARWLAAVVGALNVVAVYVSALLVTRHRAAAALAALFAAVSLDLLFLNTVILADALFIFFTLVALAGLTHSSTAEVGGAPLSVAAIATALACLTRYAGVALILTGVVVFRRRRADALLFAFIAAVPLLAWLAINASGLGYWTVDLGAPSLSLSDHLAAIAETVGSWFFPGSNRISFFPSQTLVVALAALTISVIAVGLTRRRRPFVPNVFLLFAIIYVAFILGTAAFVEQLPMDNRILAPAYVAMLIVATWILDSIPARRAIAALVAVALLGNATVTAGAIRYFRREGRGFAGPSWSYPGLQRALSAIPPRAIVVSNYPAAVDFRLGHSAGYARAHTLPAIVARHGEVILVYFDDARRYAPRHPQAMKGQPATAEHRNELIGCCEATLLARERNAWMYRLRPRRYS